MGRADRMNRIGVAVAWAVMTVLGLASVARSQTGQWVQRFPVGSIPDARSAHAMAYDPVRRETVVFGGYASGGLGYHDDTWTYDGTNWTLRATTGPSPRANASMAFDSSRGVMVLFGGYFGGSLGETWEWDGANWMQRTPVGDSPLARNDHGVAFDSTRNVTVLFGGGSTLGGSLLSDTWEWNGTAWTQRVSAGGPASHGTSMAFDAHRGVCVLFGVANSDTYEYNGVVWTRVSTTGPSWRGYAPMAYDPIRGVCVLTGGNVAGISQSGTYDWNGATWTSPDVGDPGPRQGHKLAFDTTRNALVQFGGGAGVLGNQTWVLPTLTPVFTGSYSPELGTLPEAQGWPRFQQASPEPSVASGLLSIGPTTSGGYQYWKRNDLVANFASSAGLVAEFSCQILSSTTVANALGVPQTGFGLSWFDANHRLVSVALGENGVFLRNDSAVSGVFVPIDTTSAMRSYRLIAQPTGVSLVIDGVTRASLPLGPTGVFTDPSNGPNPVFFGDGGIAAGHVRMGALRWGGLAVPFAAAGPTDNAIAPGARPDPGAGSNTTFTFNSLTIPPGGSFTLGSGETINAPGGIIIQPGAVLVANGTINGPLVNNGLLIIPITQVGLVFNTSGPGPIIITHPPITQQGQPPVVIPVPPTGPPFIGSGGYVSIGGSGFAGTNGGTPGGGSPGSGFPGRYEISGPSITVPSTVAWDGQLDVTGSYSQTPTGALRLFIAGTTQGQTYSFLNVGQAAAIEGAMQIVLQPELFSYLPRMGDTFDMVTAAGGLTLPGGPSSINVRTLMTAQGAAFLGLSLPTFNSGFAGDPNQLVSLPQNLFSYTIVDGTTLRFTMMQDVMCPAQPAPASVLTCPDQSTPVSFTVSPVSPAPSTFAWQYRGTAGQLPADWIHLNDGPNDIGEDASLEIAGAAQATLSVLRVPGAWPVSGLDAGGLFRCIVTNACGIVTSNAATLAICPSDINCSGEVSVQDIFDFLAAYFADDPRADFNATGTISVQDIFDFLAAYFSGCA
ncbi:MAG: hypothetical protein IT438_17165 [Phycisphaerales bacterium]|nr:hypothetical protein [Phycisphaerales bacterium]